jgi:hypothetical protein
VTKIVTSREWVLPPRPKPGRKPSADTPATKRKAQNRAAQRAFRERRATRVTELEERLGEVEKEKEINELNFKNIMNKLQNENKFLLKALNDIKADYSNFKNKVLSQQSNKNIINSNNNSPAVFSNGQVTSPSPLNYFKLNTTTAGGSPTAESPENINPNYKFSNQRRDSQSLQRLSVSGNNQYPQQLPSANISPAYSQSKSPANLENFSPNPNSTSSSSSVTSHNNQHFDCGVCVKDDCICEEVGIKSKNLEQKPTISFENLKPVQPVSLKRKTSDVEIDYTAKFSKTASKVNKPMPKLKKFKKISNNKEEDVAKQFSTMFDKITDQDFESPMEQCGFCSDESNCVCAQAAKQAANAITELQNHSIRESANKSSATLPPISRNSSVSQVNKLPVLHPGLTMEISESHRSSISTPKDTASDEKQPSTGGGCTGNPGTCTQCQMDPMSTLFCTTVAAKAEETEDTTTSTTTTTTAGATGATSSTTAPATVIKHERENQSPVSPPISTHSSKASSPIANHNNNITTTSTVTAEEELNSLSKKYPISNARRPSSTPSTQTPPQSNLSSVSGPSSSSVTGTPHSHSHSHSHSRSGSVSGGSAKGIYIPCADAYKTLSRHKEFHSVDFSTLVGKLNTRGMQVEVQSVANVLRELDRRLYS